MDSGLRGKKVLITGGGSGIGLGIAEAFAEEGADLCIASRNPDARVIERLAAAGVQVFAVTADVSREPDVVRMVAEARGNMGHIDVYINNAAWTWHQAVTAIDSESWNNTINTNLAACVYACREAGREMIRRQSGSILIIGSTARNTPGYTEAAYRVSKVGLKAYMENLAIELAPYGVRVNMITPGHFKTRMTGNIPSETEEKLRSLIPAHRFGQPKEVGRAAVFLASDILSGYTYGSDLVIDGALSLHPLELRSPEEIRALNDQGGDT